MGKRSREKRERMAQETDKDVERERFEPKTRWEELCLFIIKAMTYFALFTPLIMSGNFFFPFVSPKSLYFMGFAQVIFFAWLFLIFYFPKYRPRKNPILIALLLFVAVLVLSSLFGENFSNSFWSKPERMTGLLMWFHLLAFFLVTSSVFRKPDWFKVFSLSTLVGVILSFIAFFSTSEAMKGGATLGNTSFFGTYLLFNIFLSLWLFFNSKDIRWKAYFVIAPLIMFYATFSANARAATLSTLIGLGLLFLLFLAFGIKKRYLNILGRISLAAVLVIFLLLVFYLFQPDHAVHNWFVERATYSRMIVWEKSWQGFLERPLLGWGPENFDFVFIKNFNPCMFLRLCGGEIWFDRAHNIIFDTLAVTGILGMLAYLGVFFSVFYALWKRYFKNKVDFWAAGIFSVLLIAYFIQNLTVFDMVSSYLMFFLVLGFVAAVTAPGKEPVNQKSASPSSWFFAFILIFFIPAFFYFIIQPLRTSHYTVDALRTPPASEERLDLYKEALGASSLGKYQVREFFGQQALQLVQSEKARGVPAENLKKELDFVVRELEKSAEESPLDFRSQLTLGKLYSAYAVLFDPPDPAKILQAERILEKAIEISPTNQQGYWALAQTRLYQGRGKEAISLAEKAVSLEPQLLQSHHIVVQIARLIEDHELAERKIQEAVEINPEWEAGLRGGN